MKKRKGQSDRFLSGLVVGALFAGAVVCGSIGWSEYLGAAMRLTWTDIAYRLMTLFTINASFDEPGVPLLLDVARFLAPAALAGTAVLIAMGFFRTRFDSIRVRFFFRDHAVFFGCDARVLSVAEDIASRRKLVFVVPPGEDVSSGDSFFDGAASLGATVLSGFGSASGALRCSGAARAGCVFMMIQSVPAAQEFSREAESFLSAHGGKKKPSLFVGYPDCFGLWIARELDESRASRAGLVAVSVIANRFSLDLHLARGVIDRCLPDSVSAGKPCHIAVFGFGETGQALAFEAAQLFHFADLGSPRVTVVGRGMCDAWPEFLVRHPGFAAAATAEPAEFGGWRGSLSGCLPDLALIALDDANLAIETARVLRQDAERAGAKVRIVIVPPVGGDTAFPDPVILGDFLAEQDVELVDTGALISGADIIDRSEGCDAIAKGLHYSWLAKPGETWPREAVESEWAMLSDVLRDSNRYAARHFSVKLGYLGWKLAPSDSAAVSRPGSSSAKFSFADLNAAERETLGRMEHNRWSAEKYLAGYLPVDCADADRYRRLKSVNHLHANLVPWESLSPADQEKDLNALRFANEIAAAAGLVLVRPNRA
jgi:hypothetical protein